MDTHLVPRHNLIKIFLSLAESRVKCYPFDVNYDTLLLRFFSLVRPNDPFHASHAAEEDLPYNDFPF